MSSHPGTASDDDNKVEKTSFWAKNDAGRLGGLPEYTHPLPSEISILALCPSLLASSDEASLNLIQVTLSQALEKGKKLH